MNTQSNAASGPAVGSQAAAPAAVPASQLFYWSLRRELWESRWIYVAPMAAAAIFLAGFLIGLIHLPGKMRAAMALGPMQQHELIAQPYEFAELLLMGAMLIVAVFYCLDALYGERRDRSILFWKSLPVSDLTTVLAKASIPVAVLPVFTFAVTVVTQWIMFLLSSIALMGSGVSVATLWNQLPMFQMSVGLLFHLVGIHGFWYAPFYAWLLMVSGWARRAAFLWAFLPLLAIGIVEKIAFNTSHFAALLLYRLSGGPEGITFLPANMSMDPLGQLSPANFLFSPGLWRGLVLTAIFLAIAVRMRRYRGPI